MTDAEREILDRLDVLTRRVEDLSWSRSLGARAWLSVRDVAQLTGWKERTVQDKAKRGTIPMFKDGREWKMTPAAFDKWEALISRDGMARGARHPLREASRRRR